MEKQKHLITSAGVKMPRIIYQSFWTLTANPHILASNIVQTTTEVKP